MSKSKRTYFTLKDMVSFGEYLLSLSRENLYKENNAENYEERFRSVSDADIANWKEKQKAL